MANVSLLSSGEDARTHTHSCAHAHTHILRMTSSDTDGDKEDKIKNTEAWNRLKVHSNRHVVHWVWRVENKRHFLKKKKKDRHKTFSDIISLQQGRNIAQKLQINNINMYKKRRGGGAQQCSSTQTNRQCLNVTIKIKVWVMWSSPRLLVLSPHSNKSGTLSSLTP